ncbi:MAG: glutamate 5-kinase [Candidatus Omnitrophica bacterium]|nr:glutamate 5-kinase [Candidatus Omnitrophota bacterium]
MREQIIKNVKRIVVKVGSSILTTDAGYLSSQRVGKIVSDIVCLMKTHQKEVILVSSGAIACGMSILKLKRRPHDLSTLQAAAAIGQGKLMNIYEKFFSQEGYHSAQILLTIDGLHHRTRYLNARNTVNSLLQLGAIPIVNENDTVATEEIRFGDNDNLSAQVAMMTNADLLIILSDVDGFSVKHGRRHSVLSTVDTIDESLKDHLHTVEGGTTVGGMKSKLETAFFMMKLGLPTIIANGSRKDILTSLIRGEEKGTIFLPSKKRQASKKSWLAFTANLSTTGTIVVDEGAYRALVERGKSLLASGITAIKGEYTFGDAVKIVNHQGKEFAKGITNFSHTDLALIKGQKTVFIKEQFGASGYDEVIHRDNMIILD